MSLMTRRGDALYADRADAGRALARQLRHLRGHDVVVLGLTRGGVPVAAPVAVALEAPLDVIMVRKLGVPVQPEYAFGAIGENGIRVIDEHVVRKTALTRPTMARVEARERAELDRRVRELRGVRPPLALAGRTAVIVDDGFATGATARAACRVAKARGASRVVLAAPVGPARTITSLRWDADEVICARMPAAFVAIGDWYGDFSTTSDAEVRALLDGACQAGQADRLRLQ